MSNCVNLRVFHGGNFINKDNEFNYNNGSVHDGIEFGIAKFCVKYIRLQYIYCYYIVVAHSNSYNNSL